MKENDLVHRVLDWIGLLLALIFFVFGLGLLTGLILKESVLFGSGLRILIGAVLVFYGIVRGYLTYRRMANPGTEANDA